MFAVIPGDPSSDDYEDHIPDEPYPNVFVLGQVMKESPLDMKIGLPQRLSFAISDSVCVVFTVPLIIYS